MKNTIFLTFSFFCVAILFSIGFAIDSSSAADGSKVTVAYSSNILGYLEPCG